MVYSIHSVLAACRRRRGVWVFEISPSDAIGIAGIVLAILLLVLDKAGKLKGGWLYGLLAIAFVMTLFIAVGNSWVADAPRRWLLWRASLMVCVVLLAYSGMAIWISGPNEATVTPKAAAPPLPLAQGGPGDTLIGPRSSVGIMVTPARGFPKTLSFATEGTGKQEFSFDAHPSKLLFESPRSVVEEKELPREIEIGGRKVSILRFTNVGFVLDDHHVPVSGKATLLEGSTDNSGARTESNSDREEKDRVELEGRELALRNVPSVTILYTPGQIELHNTGKGDLGVHGFSYGEGDQLKRLDKESLQKDQPRFISPGYFYYLAAEPMEKQLHNSLGNNGEGFLPCRWYITTEDNKRHTVRCMLGVKVKDGVLAINTQNLGVVAGWQQ